jgi:hypothetical protein
MGCQYLTEKMAANTEAASALRPGITMAMVSNNNLILLYVST